MEAVVQISSPGLDECRNFPSLPLPDPVQVALHANGDPAAESLAAGLYYQILGRFGGLAAISGALGATICGASRLLHCRARAQPACLSLLVIVAARGMLPQPEERLALSWLTRPSSFVLIVLPPGATTAASIPASLRRTNAVNASKGIEAIADDIEVALSIRERKLFLSYRRQDASAIADELFDTFSHAGWRVYLDRFSGTPGRSFPREIAEELADKGAVLVLESPNIAASHWTLKEVAMARRLSLGLFAVNLPGSPTIGGISRRLSLRPHQLGAGGAELAQGISQEVLRFVGQGYLEQSHFRRAVMTSALRIALTGEGLSAVPGAGGCWRVRGTKYLVHLSPRPPALNALRRVTEVAGHAEKGIVIGPYKLQPLPQLSDARWLAGRLGAALEGEFRLSMLARQMRAGRV